MNIPEDAARNSLGEETSPYLLQHADNPVAWSPWGPEALDRARRENKPILLSIGYSACHWCHVMAHESFEDPQTAELMNIGFVNIKVDREERPDLDKIYQTAHQLLARRPGGWPLTVFLAPDDHAPFFAGTYFPKDRRYGMPSFKEVLSGVAALYQNHREDIHAQNQSLMSALSRMQQDDQDTRHISERDWQTAQSTLLRSFDSSQGGFGGAPKFPHPANIDLLLRHAHALAVDGARDDGGRHAALFSLRRMALGGLFDHLGGGFCRYSVDEFWMIPHFEKMLYDNGPLLHLCAQAWQLTGDMLFRNTATQTAGWVMREMQHAAGGYYSSLDADSEGEEGKYYVWSKNEVLDLLNDAEYELVAARYGLDRPANFEGQHWHLHVYAELEALSPDLNADMPTLRARLEQAHEKLFAAREQRVRPGLDDKILTAWNGLMIKGMAEAGRILDQPDYVESAQRAADFVRSTLWRDGRLLATSRGEKSHLNAYLDDYVLMIDGLLSLLRADWRSEDLAFASALADAVLEHFEDTHAGGFYFTSHDHEALIQRPKPFMDDSIPAGNATAGAVLTRLGHLLGESRYLDSAARLFDASAGSVARAPHAHASLLLAWKEFNSGGETIVLRGAGEALNAWRRRCDRPYVPERMTYAIPDGVNGLPGVLAARAPVGEAVAYVCTGLTCSAPIQDLATLEQTLRANEVQTTD